MFGRAFMANPEQVDRAMNAWESGWIEAEYAYCA